MKKTRTIIISGVLLTSLAAGVAQEQGANEKPRDATEPKIATAAAVSWRDAPGLPAGAQIAALDGDPRKEGSFTIRLRMPAGYKIPPHTHTTAERITVISGVVQLGIGEKFDESGGRELKAGDFAVVPAGLAHFAWATGDAVLQIQSEGPFQRDYVGDGSVTPR